MTTTDKYPQELGEDEAGLPGYAGEADLHGITFAEPEERDAIDPTRARLHELGQVALTARELSALYAVPATIEYRIAL